MFKIIVIFLAILVTTFGYSKDIDFDFIPISDSKCLLSEVKTVKNLEFKKNAENKILVLINNFLKQEESNNDYEEFIMGFRQLLNELEKILENSEVTRSICKKLKETYELVFTKYRNYAFSHYGFIVNSCHQGYHVLLLQMEYEDSFFSKIADRMSISYQIIPDKDIPVRMDLTNVSLIFLNDLGFEVYRVNIGNLKKDCTVTGSFEISTENYSKIRYVNSVSDQDKEGDSFFHFGISATPYCY
jgi:hypothetical protein